MAVLSTNRSKILVSLGIVGAGGVGLAIAIPYLLDHPEEQKAQEIPQENKPDIDVQPINPDPLPPAPPVPPQPPAAKPVVPPAKPPAVAPGASNGSDTATKLQTLKNNKTTLTNNVSTFISKTSGQLKNIQTKAILENALKNCLQGKPDQLDKEKNDLTTKYDAFKNTHKSALEIQKKITGELSTLESNADRNETDADRYKKFEDKYNEINGEFEKLQNKKTDEEFGKSLKTLSEKMGAAYDTCSIKDLIKINDFLGLNSARPDQNSR